MEPALGLATAIWVGFLIYGVWLCIRGIKSSHDDEDAARPREKKRSGAVQTFEHPEDCV